MNYLLLVGAGFTRNWGGWLSNEVFEYLLGCPEIRDDQFVHELMWKWLGKGGFEYMLADVQRHAVTNPTSENKSRLASVNAAVSRMLADMNSSIIKGSLEFQIANSAAWIGSFLSRFNAIFSLNQDLFFEHHYLSITFSMPYYGQWAGHELPGMKVAPGQEPFDWQSWGRQTWQPATPTEFLLRENHQPLFKLHGSANWKDSSGRNLLVMGGDKSSAIRREPVLAWYAEKFDAMLCNENTRLMIIGYGFLDPHINMAIEKAISHHGLQIFNISPEGGEHARRVNTTRVPGLVTEPTSLEYAFEKGLIGASRRPLNQIFGADETERKKLFRFFEH